MPLGESPNDKEFCPHLHVECFTCEDLPSYITQTQAEASKTPEEDKAFLGIAKQVKLLEKEAASDTTVGKPYAKSKINITSQDVKVAWLQIEIQSSETEIKTLWIKNEAAIAKVAKPNGELSLAENTAAWTKHPLQASNIPSSALIVGTALQVEMNDAKLSLSENRAIDAQGNLWLKVDVLDDKNRKRSGWVLVNGEGAKRVCCWDWFDFTQIKETATLKDIYLDADKSLKRNKDNHSLSQYKPTIKETLSILDKQHPVETNIYTSIKEASFKGIADKPMLFTALSRLLVNYESEWYSEIDAEGKMPKWEALNSEMTEKAKNVLMYLKEADEAKFEAYLSSVDKAKDSPEAKGFETLRREINRFPADYKESPSKKLTKEQFESYAKMEALEKQVTAWEKTKEKIKKMLWWDDVAKGLSKLNQQNDTPPKNGEATSTPTTEADTTPPATLSADGKAWFVHPIALFNFKPKFCITVDMLKRIFTQADNETLNNIARDINKNYKLFHLDTELRLTHFFAQSLQEVGAKYTSSAESLNYSYSALSAFSYFRENPSEAKLYGRVDKPENNPHAADQEAIANRVYGNRMGNGDINSGDGWKFRGRGMFQLTGKANYQGLTDWYEQTYKTRVDFVTNPDLVLSKNYLLLSAVYFWLKYKLHKKADNGDKGEHVDKITEIINKNTKTYENRRENFEKIKKEKIFDSISF
ncbi:MAG: hypothetical protein J6583_12220 [Gilliamella sp.]|nr:hypothetical protein [Gilliamella sp.]